MNPEVLHTKWGLAKISNRGYYRITSYKEGNYQKLLHRLIYENFWGVKLPSQIHVHHKDGNRLNNCILNLEAIAESDHNRLHKVGEKNPMFNKCKEKSPVWGKPRSMEFKQKISKSKSTTGIFRVSKVKSKTAKQGFLWRYAFYDGGKVHQINSVSLDTLKNRVLNNGWEWIEFDKE